MSMHQKIYLFSLVFTLLSLSVDISPIINYASLLTKILIDRDLIVATVSFFTFLKSLICDNGSSQCLSGGNVQNS